MAAIARRIFSLTVGNEPIPWFAAQARFDNNGDLLENQTA